MLFDRSRSGYVPTELAQALAEHAEQLEVALESARSAAQLLPHDVSGIVRITTADTILHGLVAPAMKNLSATHPLLTYELHSTNELTNLTRRDADIAVRATKRPPEHLIGKHVGSIRMALFSSKKGAIKRYADVEAGKGVWIAVDDAMPEHRSVIWRKRHFPKAVPTYRVNSVLMVMELVALGLGIAVLPMFLAEQHPKLIPLTEALPECQTELWLLTHPESRHLRGVSTVYGHLARTLVLR